MPAFIGITSPLSGNGSGTVTYNVNANGVSARSGTLTIAGQTFTVNQFGTGPTVNLDRTSLRYGATLSGALVTAQTSAQTVRLTQSSGPAVTWTATSNQPWLQVSPGSGSGGARAVDHRQPDRPGHVGHGDWRHHNRARRRRQHSRTNRRDAGHDAHRHFGQSCRRDRYAGQQHHRRDGRDSRDGLGS